MYVVFENITIAVALKDIDLVTPVNRIGNYNSKEYERQELPNHLTLIPDENILAGEAAQVAIEKTASEKLKAKEEELDEANLKVARFEAIETLVADGVALDDAKKYAESKKHPWDLRSPSRFDVEKFLAE